MNRRTFTKNVAGALVAAPVLVNFASESSKASQTRTDSPVSYQLSVMLWTVFRDLPFEQRLAKVAAAGYRNVELVGEYEKWADEDFNHAIAKRKELGIRFDCTAGLKHSLCNPTEREALLAEF